MRVFHGTYWEKPDCGDDTTFIIPQVGYSDDEVVYFSNTEKVAKRFSKWHTPDETAVALVLIVGNLTLKNPYYFRESKRHWCVDGVDVSLDERIELYQVLKNLGYDAFIVENNYSKGENDICVFDDSAFEPTSLYLRLPGKDWSEELSIKKAKEMFFTFFD